MMASFCLSVYVSLSHCVHLQVAQLIVLVFLWEYPSEWPTFFADLLPLEGLAVMDVFLRVLTAIDECVVDRDMPRTPVRHGCMHM